MRLPLISLVCLLVSAGATAADAEFYLGAGIARRDGDLLPASTSVDRTGYTAFVGIRPARALAIEAGYINLGGDELNVPPVCCDVPYYFSQSLRGIDVFATGFWSISNVDLFGKIGVIEWRSRTLVVGGLAGSIQYNRSGNGLAYGAGAQLNFHNFGARAEYTRFDTQDTNIGAGLSFGNQSAISLSVLWKFL